MPDFFRRLRRGQLQRSRGQSVVEFALVFPIFFLLLAGIIQFGLIFWSQNTLTQIARDTGRWAATQQVDCTSTGPVISKANQIAGASALLGYSGGWTSSNVIVTWRTDSGTCPPKTNQEESWVKIELHHRVPIFFPLVPGDGNLATSAEFRMEPVP